MAGKRVSVYVAERDLALWERAERVARKRRMPLSGLVMTALEAYLAEEETGAAGREPGGR